MVHARRVSLEDSRERTWADTTKGWSEVGKEGEARRDG